MSIPLAECIHSHEDEWVEEHREAANEGVIESQIILAQVSSMQLLLTGAGNTRPDPARAVQYLKAASRKSGEACLKLGKLYLKGEKVQRSLSKAYFYLRVSTLFKCKCGSFAEFYHSKAVSNPHLCYPTEGWENIQKIPENPQFEAKFRDQFNAWRRG